MVLIPKSKGVFWGIGIVEVARKVCAAVVNCRLKQGDILHDALHRFRERRGTGTDTLETKMDQQLAGIAHEPFFQVFLEICNSYDSIDRGRCSEVLRGYYIGLNLAHLCKSYWERQRILQNTGESLSKEFWTGVGGRLMQGYPTSPMIFNIVVDVVVREVLDVVYQPQESKHGLGLAAGERNVIFYVNDGRI